MEWLLRELETALRRMVANDSQAAAFAEDVRGEIRRLELGLEAAPDEALSDYASRRLEETVLAIEPLLLELQLFTPASHGDGDTSLRADALAHYRPHFSTLLELLRPLA